MKKHLQLRHGVFLVTGKSESTGAVPHVKMASSGSGEEKPRPFSFAMNSLLLQGFHLAMRSASFLIRAFHVKVYLFDHGQFVSMPDFYSEPAL